MNGVVRSSEDLHPGITFYLFGRKGLLLSYFFLSLLPTQGELEFFFKALLGFILYIVT